MDSQKRFFSILCVAFLMAAAGCRPAGPVSVSAEEINLTAQDLGGAFNLAGQDGYNPAMPPEVSDYNQRIFSSQNALIYARVIVYSDVVDADQISELHRASLESELKAGMEASLEGFDPPVEIQIGRRAVLEKVNVTGLDGQFLIWADRNVVFELIAIGRPGAVRGEEIQELAKTAWGRLK